MALRSKVHEFQHWLRVEERANDTATLSLVTIMHMSKILQVSQEAPRSLEDPCRPATRTLATEGLGRGPHVGSLSSGSGVLGRRQVQGGVKTALMSCGVPQGHRAKRPHEIKAAPRGVHFRGSSWEAAILIGVG